MGPSRVYDGKSGCQIIKVLPPSQKKVNLGGDVTFSGTTNLDKGLSRFIVLGDVTYLLEFFFFLTEYSLYRMLKKEERERKISLGQR